MCCQMPGRSMNLQSIILAPCFSAYLTTSLGVMCAALLFPCLDGVLALFAGADADHLVDGRHEDLAVADAAGLGGLGDGRKGPVDESVLHDDLDLHLGNEVDHVGGAAVDLLLAAGPPEALDLGDGHALPADLGGALLHLVELEGLDDGLDLLHGNGLADRCCVGGSVPSI